MTISGNSVLKHLWVTIDPYTGMALSRQASGVSVTPNIEKFYEEHLELLNIIRSADLPRACEALYEHIYVHPGYRI